MNQQDNRRARAARRVAHEAFERRTPAELRYTTTPQLVGFLFDALTSELAIERCEHLQPGRPAPRFALVAVPGRIVCHRCRTGLLLSAPALTDDRCDRCAPPLWGKLDRHSAVIGQLTVYFSLCEWCSRDLGIAR